MRGVATRCAAREDVSEDEAPQRSRSFSARRVARGALAGPAARSARCTQCPPQAMPAASEGKPSEPIRAAPALCRIPSTSPARRCLGGHPACRPASRPPSPASHPACGGAPCIRICTARRSGHRRPALHTSSTLHRRRSSEPSPTPNPSANRISRNAWKRKGRTPFHSPSTPGGKRSRLYPYPQKGKGMQEHRSKRRHVYPIVYRE